MGRQRARAHAEVSGASTADHKAHERALRRLARRRLPPQPARRRHLRVSGEHEERRTASCACSTRRTRWRSSSSRPAAPRPTATQRILDIAADRAAPAHAALHRQQGRRRARAVNAEADVGADRGAQADRRAAGRNAARRGLALRHSDRAVYRPGDAPSTTRATSATRASSRSRAACSRRCTAGGSGRCGSTPASAPPRRRTVAFSYLLDAGQTGCQRRLRSADADGHRFRLAARDSARSAASAWRSIRVEDMHDAVRRDSARQGLDVDDDQRDGVDAARDVHRRRRGAGRRRATAQRHDPERHPQGVHRARHVHLSARAVAAR